MSDTILRAAGEDTYHAGVMFLWALACQGTDEDLGTYVERRFHELQAMPYRDYLWSDEWRLIIRSVALEAAERRCQVCNSPHALNVHHRRYPTRGFERFGRDLTVLCADCHGRFHETGRLVR